MTVLFVVTEEGYWGEECMAPLKAVKEDGRDVEVATPSGGKPVIDDVSTDPGTVGEETATEVRDFHSDNEEMNDPIPLAEAYRNRDEYRAVVFPGGHGTVWDICIDDHAQGLLKYFMDNGKALVICHAVGLLGFTKKEGQYIVNNLDVTGFPDEWEDDQVDENEIRGDRKLPYRVQQKVVEAGGNWDAELGKDSSVQIDGNLITARGPDSSERGAERLIESL